MKTVFKRWLSAFMVLIITITTVIGSVGTINANSGKKLGDSIVKVKIFDTANDRDLYPKNGVYEMVTNRGYKFEINFDLSKYNEKLEDGDYFTLTIPEVFTITNTDSFYLSDSGVEIGKVEPISNGDNKGGTVKVTLQKLKEYLAAKGGDAVRDVKGTFYIEFQMKKDAPEQDIKFDDTEVKDPITLKVKGITPPPPVVPTEHVGKASKENFAKNGGIISRADFFSAKLNRNIKYVHTWNLRINTVMKSYNELIVFDDVDQDGGHMQFIPESFKVTSGEFPKSLSSIEKATVLVEGQDYEIEYLDGYTKFRLKFLKPEIPIAYRVEYKTTAPADGSIIGNTLSLMGNGTNLKQNEAKNATASKVTKESKVTDGGSITLTTGHKILIYKVDKDTGNPIQGVKFIVTTPENKEVELKATDEFGRTISEAFPTDLVSKGNFIIKEVTPPGYKAIDPIVVKVGEKGVIKTIKNEKIKTNLEILKTWDDNNNSDGLRPDELTFDIKSSDGKTITKTINKSDFEKTNDNEWKYVVKDIPVYGENGVKLQYTVEEKAVDKYQTKIGAVKEVSDTKMAVEITNSHTPETTSVSISKEWRDSNNKAGLRPEKIIVKVMDGTEVVRSEEVRGNSNTWTHKFENLPKYKNGQQITYTIAEEKVEHYTALVTELTDTPTGEKFGAIINTHVPTMVNIEGTKTWEDNKDQDGKRPQNITVKLMNGSELVEQKIVDATTNWTYKFENKPEFKNGKKINYTIDEEAVEGYEKIINGYNITNRRVSEKITISGQKTWDDANNQDGKRPESITVKLMDGTNVVETLEVRAGQNGSWKYTFKEVPKYRDGKVINYTVFEEAVNEYEAPVYDGYNITNKRVPEKFTISGQKTWDDANNQDGKRPESITVKLMDGIDVVDTVKVMADNTGSWKYTFKSVPKYRDGKEIVYKVVEEPVEGYTIDVGGYDITNRRIPEKITISGEKTWDDANNQDGKRPESITVKLMDGTNVVETINFKADQDGNWKYTFKEVPKYRDGKEIVYTVEEEAVAEYTTEVKGYNITNKYTPETVTISGEKTWDDANNQDGKRPESINVKLMDGNNIVEVKTVKADQDGNWKYTFKVVPKYRDGKLINYTVEEEAVAEYTTEVKGYDIKNKHIPEVVKISGEKTWDDANNQDGKRPESINVKLMDGNNIVEVKTVKADQDGNWKYTFKVVPKYRDGKLINYTVEEEAVAEYTTEVKGYDIKNKHIPEVVKISGEKTWDDANNQDGKRPESINVKLMDGTNVVETVKVMADNNGDWKYTFKVVPKYRNGKLINYTVEEEAVAGYTTEVKGYDIKNKHIPEVVEISGEKTWDDSNDKAGKRPESINVKLMDGTNVVETVKVMADKDGNWKYTFKEVPKYRDGVEIVYTVEEEAVEGYTTEVKGYNITNKFKEESVSPLPGDDNKDPNKKPNKSGKNKYTIPTTGIAGGTGGLLLARISLMGIVYSIKKKED